MYAKHTTIFYLIYKTISVSFIDTWCFNQNFHPCGSSVWLPILYHFLLFNFQTCRGSCELFPSAKRSSKPWRRPCQTLFYFFIFNPQTLIVLILSFYIRELKTHLKSKNYLHSLGFLKIIWSILVVLVPIWALGESAPAPAVWKGEGQA